MLYRRMLRRGVRIALVAVVTLFALTACRHPHRVIDQPLPDRDIVFQAVLRYSQDKRIGFVNADGRGLTFVRIISTGISWVEKPTWTSDGQWLLFYNDFTHMFVGVTQSGELRQYGGTLFGAAPVSQKGRVVLAVPYDETRLQIALFDLDAGEVLRTFVMQTDGYLNVGTNALAGSKLIYGRWWELSRLPSRGVYEIVLLDIDSGEERVLVHKEGEYPYHVLRYPAISPDGEWVAYTAVDGLYLIRPDGTDEHRVLALDMLRLDGVGSTSLMWDRAPAAVCWSPDSRSLVYHRCLLPSPEPCLSPESYGIFKLDLETLQEENLLEGGLYPYWRLAPSPDAE